MFDKCLFPVWDHRGIIIPRYRKGCLEMTLIRPMRALNDTSKIFDLAHSAREPIFITKNGYNDLVLMSSEFYEKLMEITRIDLAIFEAEQEMCHGAEAVLAESVFDQLEKKYFWYI